MDIPSPTNGIQRRHVWTFGGGVAGMIAVILLWTMGPIEMIVGGLSGMTGTELLGMACKACEGSGGSGAGAGGSGAAGSGGPSSGGGGRGPSAGDMAESTATGLGSDAATEAAGGTAKSAAGKAGWGIIGTMLSLLLAGPTVYEGVESVKPTKAGDQGLGKKSKGAKLSHWRARNPNKPISEFPGNIE